ncbi:MAG: alpha/beta hydrolase [Proteobacteria bacterium]|nr:alpha/beta hydrolase [Pseudomonadota bacterium]
MEIAEIIRDVQGAVANLALRMPISWINILAGPSVTVDGRTLDGRTQWFLQLLARSGQKPLPQIGVERARTEFDGFQAIMGGKPAPVGEIVDRAVEDASGRRLRVRIYRPAGSVARLLPAILYFHGGGFTIGSLEGYDLPCRFFCARTGCVVVSVDYRLAPEHKFPAAPDDAVASFHWLAANATGLGIDPARIVVAGDSAGGTLAAVVAQETRDAPRRPCLQWLIYPAADLAGDTDSHRSCGEGFLLTQADMEWFRDNYLATPAEADDPRASPLRAENLAGLPPALVFTAGFDPLRDEGQAYAGRLAAAGVKTIHREFDSLIHGFICMRGALQGAARAMDEMVAGVRHELARLGH